MYTYQELPVTKIALRYCGTIAAVKMRSPEDEHQVDVQQHSHASAYVTSLSACSSSKTSPDCNVNVANVLIANSLYS